MDVAITGAMGSGKSYVAEQLKKMLGWNLFDCDSHCRELMLPGNEGYNKFIAETDEKFVTADGEIDREKLRKSLISDDSIRSLLENILHPMIQSRICAHKRENVGLESSLYEIPLLFEVGWEDKFDLVIVTYAPADVCIERTIKRSGISEDQAKRISAIQLSSSAKAKRADRVIDNSGKMNDTRIQIKRMVELLKVEEKRKSKEKNT